MAGEFTYTGNEVDVYLDGVKVDLLQTISGNSSYGQQPASGIGDIHNKEHLPSRAEHQITIDRMALRKDSLVAMDIILENGDAAMRGKTFDIEIFSKEGPLLHKFIKAVNDSNRVNVTAHRIVISDAVFVARDQVGTGSLG